WIPLTEPVVTAPLTILDGTSLLTDDLIACDLEYPDRMGEIHELAYNPLQLWYYYPAMLMNEALLFKGYDTMTDGRVRYAPHSAFKHPEEGPHSPIRRSIEFRAIATFMDKGSS
ncbi:MAG: CmcJ/NvfI family oxidoreductase, partial [Pseudomonadota bacterium]